MDRVHYRFLPWVYTICIWICFYIDCKMIYRVYIKYSYTIMTTLVSCYYKLGKSKHTHEEYDTWIRNLLVNINTNIVIFTSKNEKSYLETILEDNKNIKSTIIVKELSDLEINNLYPDIWEGQELMDPNKRCGRARGCYQLWNSKFHLLKEAIERFVEWRRLLKVGLSRAMNRYFIERRSHRS